MNGGSTPTERTERVLLFFEPRRKREREGHHEERSCPACRPRKRASLRQGRGRRSRRQCARGGFESDSHHRRGGFEYVTSSRETRARNGGARSGHGGHAPFRYCNTVLSSRRTNSNYFLRLFRQPSDRSFLGHPVSTGFPQSGANCGKV